MTAGGWLAIILAVGGVTLWVGWCFYKVFSTPDASRMTAEPTIDPPDARKSREQGERED